MPTMRNTDRGRKCRQVGIEDIEYLGVGLLETCPHRFVDDTGKHHRPRIALSGRRFDFPYRGLYFLGGIQKGQDHPVAAKIIELRQ